LKIYGLLVFNIILLVFGQTLWKIGVTNIEFKLSLMALIKIIINPYILSGIVAYGVATIIWLYILSKAELSLIYPMQSICYVLAAFISLYIFKENIPPTRWFGIMLIISGAYFVSIK